MAKQSRAKRTRRILLAALGGLLAVAAIVFLLVGCGDKSPAPDPVDLGLTLNEHSVALEKDETFRLRLIRTSDGEPADDVDVEWTSDVQSVATVSEDGLITAAGKGESAVSANFEVDGNRYSFSCVVTVKVPDGQYSSYRVRYFTQNKDRIGYTSVEESYEREVGSEVSLSQVDARRRLPGNYVLNTEKSVLSGTVQKDPGATVLDIYYDVAEITYYVDAYYESINQLGTYGEKETVAHKAYAFTEVHAAPNAKKGFVLNDKAPGSVLSNGSVTAGAHLVAYYDRARGNVTVSYAGSKPQQTYEHVYGRALPDGALEDDIAPLRESWKVNGKTVAYPEDEIQYLSGNITASCSVDGAYVTYDAATRSVVNATTRRNQNPYAMLERRGKTLYFKTTVHTTGIYDPNFGILLQANGNVRMLHFSGNGMIMLRDHNFSSGMNGESGSNNTNMSLLAGATFGAKTGTNAMAGKIVGYQWAPNPAGQFGCTVDIPSRDMTVNEPKAGTPGTHTMEFLVLDGWCYAMVDGTISVSVCLKQLETSWTEDTVFEMGISTWYGSVVADPMSFGDMELLADDDEGLQNYYDYRSNKVSDSVIGKNEGFGWDAFHGVYWGSSKGGSSYLLGKSGTDLGASAHVRFLDWNNSGSAMGVTVDWNGQSMQFVSQRPTSGSEPGMYRRQRNHTWTPADIVYLNPKQITGWCTDGHQLFEANGIDAATNHPVFEGDVSAYVKDGSFYVFFNGVQVYEQSLNVIFPDYAAGDEVSVGFESWDTNNGLASFSDIRFGTAEEVRAGNGDAELVDWAAYVDYYGRDTASGNAFEFDPETGVIQENPSKSMNAAYLDGISDTWQIDGTMRRTTGLERSAAFGVTVYCYDTGVTSMIRMDNQGIFAASTNKAAFVDAPHYFNATTPKADNTKILFRNDISTFASQSSSRADVRFRFVIYKDILYFWINTEANPDELTLVAAMPLTSDDFGRHKAGSRYRVGFNTDSTVDTMCGQLQFNSFSEKLGRQVTDQKDFLTVDGKQYSLDEAIAAVNANMSRFEVDANMRYSGVLLEDVGVPTPPAAGNIGAAFGPEQAGDSSETFTVAVPENAGSMSGIAVRSGGETVYILADRDGYVKLLSGDQAALGGQWGPNNAVPVSLGGGVKVFADGLTSKVTVTVQDGVLYVSFNGKAAFKTPLSGLLGGYKAGDKVSFGVATYNPAGGSALFSDFAFTGDGNTPEIGGEAQKSYPSFVNTHFAIPRNNATLTDGNLTLPLGGRVDFRETAKTWEFSGTMKRPINGDNAGKAAGFSVLVYDGDGAIGMAKYKVRMDLLYAGVNLFVADGTSEATYAWANWAREDLGAEGTDASYCVPPANISPARAYQFRTDAADFLSYNHTEKPATRGTMQFKIVLYEDVLYFWFDSAENPGQLQLNMRFPLTESGFLLKDDGSTKNAYTPAAPGSDYTISISSYGAATDCGVEVEGFKVLLGDEVTDNADFIKTKDGKSHTVAEAAAAIKENISRFSEDYRPHHMRLAGALAEGMEEYGVDVKRGETGHVVAANWFMPGKSAVSTDLYLSAHITHLPKVPRSDYTEYYRVSDMYGILIKDSSGKAIRQIFASADGLILLTTVWNCEGIPAILENNGNVTTDVGYFKNEDHFGEYMWGYGNGQGTPLTKIVKYKDNPDLIKDFKLDFEAAITDNVLYIRINGFTLARFPLDKLCADWTPGTTYTMGFDVWDSADTHGYRFDNVVSLQGEKALAKMNTGAAVPGAEVSGMHFDAVTGSYAGTWSARNVITRMLGAARAGNQALSFKLKLATENSASLNGLALKADGALAYVLFGKDGKVHLLSGSTADNADYAGAGRDAGIAAFTTDAVSVTAVVRDGTLYVSVNGKGFSVPMTKLIAGYTSDGELQLGVATYAPGKGAASFGEITFTDGSAEGFPQPEAGDYPSLPDAQPVSHNIFKLLFGLIRRLILKH